MNKPTLLLAFIVFITLAEKAAASTYTCTDEVRKTTISIEDNRIIESMSFKDKNGSYGSPRLNVYRITQTHPLQIKAVRETDKGFVYIWLLQSMDIKDFYVSYSVAVLNNNSLDATNKFKIRNCNYQ